MRANDLTYGILKCAYKVHSTLGPGLLESSYEAPLIYELKAAGFSVEQQKALPLMYNDIKLDVGYRVDLIVEDQVIIELKSVAALEEIHAAQLLTYLKLSNCKVGLLLNFNVTSLKYGIRRIVNKFDDSE
ncbi:GxxExxY protein [Bacteroidota bacterium]